MWIIQAICYKDTDSLTFDYVVIRNSSVDDMETVFPEQMCVCAIISLSYA